MRFADHRCRPCPEYLPLEAREYEYQFQKTVVYLYIG